MFKKVNYRLTTLLHTKTAEIRRLVRFVRYCLVTRVTAGCY